MLYISDKNLEIYLFKGLVVKMEVNLNNFVANTNGHNFGMIAPKDFI